ncbi:MAG: GreA/GreB family elongation factor [Verrucomicrobia bacterium]|nr:GreA/GreB family elongation factor [Verrucomicrobiota bacterium]
MKEEFEKMVLAGKLQRHHVTALVQLASGGFCTHRSWGSGKITSVDTVVGRVIIDFPGKPGHVMDLSFAAESLKAIPSDHILAQKISNLAGLRQMAALHHLDLIKLVLKSYGGRATQDQLQQVIVPDIIADDWKKWWEVARRELKKDGHFVVPTKKSEPIIYQAEEVAPQTRFLADFRAAKGLKIRHTVAGEMLKNLEDFADKAGTASEVINTLNAEITSHQRTQPALAMEASFVRDDIRAACGLPPAEGEVTADAIWAQNVRVGQILEQMPAAKHKRTLQSFKDATAGFWHEAVLSSLNTVPAKVCAECIDMLISGGKLAQLKELLARLISQHQASSELLLWLAKERSDTFADILGPEVFRAMLTAMERDQFNERRSNRLRDFILDDQELLVELIESADIEVIKDLTRALQLSPSFDDMDKRSLLARIVKNFPAVQALISGEHTKQEATLIVSWESLERRKNEYTELVQKKIPANSKEIAIARSYGDLRENHEYKAAKEMQKILMRQKAELEDQLGRTRGTDFLNPRTDVVSVGTTVRVTDLNNQHAEAYTILGAWDFDLEKGVISYLTPMAQALLNNAAGSAVEFDMEGVKRRYRIDAIEAAKLA